MKNALITEAENCKCRYRVYQYRHATTTSGRAQRNGLFSWDRSKAEMHTQRKGVGIPLVRRSTVKRQLSHLYRSVLLGLCLPSKPFIWFLLQHLTYPGTLPWGTHTPLGQDGSWSDGFWEEPDLLWPGVIPQLLTPRSLSETSEIPPFKLALYVALLLQIHQISLNGSNLQPPRDPSSSL